MSSVKGTFRNGVARPLESVDADREGQAVIITFVGKSHSAAASPTDGAEWDALAELLDECAVDTGVADLAREHDHYLYDKPKAS